MKTDTIISQGLIGGMTLHVADPVDKVEWLKKIGISPDSEWK